MRQTHLIHWKALLMSLAISVGAGAVSARLAGDSMQVYGALASPPLAPPGVVFPIVWTALYLLMGLSAYLVWQAASPWRRTALALYAMQLIVNALWSPVFFGHRAYLIAFVLLVMLLLLLTGMMLVFYKVSKTAAVLQLPYWLWVMFAGYLNLGFYWLNR